MGQDVILIVEDDEYMRGNVALYLKREEYSVLEADSGLSALKMVERDRPDLIVLDITLPDLSGFAVCAEVRRRFDIPIVFIGRSADAESMIEGLELGGDDYLAKPFEPRVLATRIKAILRRYRRTEQRTEGSAPVGLAAFAANLLTNREIRILELIADGCKNEDIARQLSLTVGTVKWFNTQIFNKLKVKNRTQAIAKYNELRYIGENT